MLRNGLDQRETRRRTPESAVRCLAMLVRNDPGGVGGHLVAGPTVQPAETDSDKRHAHGCGKQRSMIAVRCYVANPSDWTSIKDPVGSLEFSFRGLAGPSGQIDRHVIQGVMIRELRVMTSDHVVVTSPCKYAFEIGIRSFGREVRYMWSGLLERGQYAGSSALDVHWCVFGPPFVPGASGLRCQAGTVVENVSLDVECFVQIYQLPAARLIDARQVSP